MSRTRRYKPIVSGVKRCHPRVKKGTAGRCLPPSVRRSLTRKQIGANRGLLRGAQGANRKQCTNDECLINSSNLDPKTKTTLLKDYFRPEQPSSWKSDPDRWLTNEDIEQVLKQYQEAYPDFKFLGVVPIDFSHPDIYGDLKKCLNQVFCTVNIAEEKRRGTRIIGAVFNLDHHLKGGSHWVAAAIDLPRRRIYYFDSYGLAPPPQIARFMRSFTMQDPSLRLEQNGRRFQYGNSECGMYSTYFLIRMVEGESFQSFVRRPITDTDIRAARQILYRETP